MQLLRKIGGLGFRDEGTGNRTLEERIGAASYALLVIALTCWLEDGFREDPNRS